MKAALLAAMILVGCGGAQRIPVNPTVIDVPDYLGSCEGRVPKPKPLPRLRTPEANLAYIDKYEAAFDESERRHMICYDKLHQLNELVTK